MQSSIVASRTGTNGTTSVAPIRGCSPVWRVRSIRSVATRMAASAASTLASGGATNVNTERLWAASAWTSSSLTPGPLESALRRASMVAASQDREVLEGDPGRAEGLPRLGERRDVAPAVALPGAESARAPVHALSRHIVHDAGAQRSFHQPPDRDRVLRIAVQKIRRAVERIHNPHDVAHPRRTGRQLFAHYARLRHRLQQTVRDQRLGLPVRLGHEVVATFFDPVAAARARGTPSATRGELPGM